MKKYSIVNKIKQFTPLRKAVISHGGGFWGIPNISCHSERSEESSVFCESVKPEYVLAKVCDYAVKQTACHTNSKIQESLPVRESMIYKSAGLPRSLRSLAMTCNAKKAAFTLAETLITLLVIGVVAALTIPALMQQIGDYTLQKQKKVFEKKLTEGFAQMRVDGKLEAQYSTTEDFINEMQKYFKIAQICNKDNLTNCFSDKIIVQDENEAETYQTASFTSTKQIDNNSKYDSEVFGLVLSDGTSLLLTHDTNDCTGIDSGNSEADHVLSDITFCNGIIYDVNGKEKGPSQLKKDIAAVNINIQDYAFKIDGTKFVSSVGNSVFADISPTSWWQEDSTFLQKYNIPVRADNSYLPDYYAGASKYCIDNNMRLMNENEYEKLMSTIMSYTKDNNKEKVNEIMGWLVSGTNSGDYTEQAYAYIFTNFGSVTQYRGDAISIHAGTWTRYNKTYYQAESYATQNSSGYYQGVDGSMISSSSGITGYRNQNLFRAVCVK